MITINHTGYKINLEDLDALLTFQAVGMNAAEVDRTVHRMVNCAHENHRLDEYLWIKDETETWDNGMEVKRIIYAKRDACWIERAPDAIA